MVIKKQIALDFGRDTITITVFAKQYDKDSRIIDIVPLSSGQPLKLEDGTTAKLKLTKADGKAVISSCKISDGKISVELSEQCLTSAGTARAEIALYKDDKLLSSQVFYIEVKKSAFNEEEAAESNNDFKEIITEISELKTKIESTENLITYPRKEAITIDEIINNTPKEDEIFNVIVDASEIENGEITLRLLVKCGKCEIVNNKILFDKKYTNIFPDLRITPEEQITEDNNSLISFDKGVEIEKVYTITEDNTAVDVEFLQYIAGTLKSFRISNIATYDDSNKILYIQSRVIFAIKGENTEQANDIVNAIGYLLKGAKGLVVKYKKIANVKTAEVLL
ncbi:MAG: BppU family phage baseplate upper protein [Candidatus Fimenecus sp.]